MVLVPDTARTAGALVTMPRTVVRALLTLCAGLALLFASMHGQAKVRTRPHFAGDLNAVVPLTQGAVWGPGVGVRGGLRVGVPALALTPELGGEILRFAGERNPDVLRAIGGLRLSLGSPAYVGAFAHAGFGHLIAFRPEGARGWNRTAFTYDVGGELGYLIAPTVKVGLHGSYGSLAAGDTAESFDWITIGLAFTLVF